MNKLDRKNQILAVLLIVQVVLAVTLLWPKKASTVTGGPLLTDLDQVTQVHIQDEAGNAILLSKASDGWVLPKADDYPVQADKVQALFDKLAQFKTNRLVTQTASSHRRLRVASDSFVRRVTLTRADGSTQTFFLGSAPSYGTIHIRMDRQDQVYLVSGLSTVDVGTGASSWIDTLYLGIETAKIFGLTIENASGILSFSKGQDGVWSMAGLSADEELDQTKITTQVSRISSLRMVKPLGKENKPEYGMQSPGAVITIKTQDDQGNQETIVLRVGAKNEESKSYVVISSKSPYYVEVNSFSVEDFVEETRQYFIKEPPTPTPQS